MKVIGRYEIERELGRGAMGVVYLAHDPRLNRKVAVKTYSLPDGISEEMAKHFHERFLREARAAASLSHPGIVTIYDAGEDADQKIPYIAMELIPGESLKQRLDKGGRLDPDWVVAFGAVLAEALGVAHRAGIVHRDIKPANILIREGDGAVKIADFGVARLKASDLTQSGTSLGSPGYMSPEQVRCAPLDGRSDLFSLAVVLYEALCGKRPFHGDDLVALAYSIAHDTQVPLSRQLRDCPPGLDRFFDRALSKDPDKRFPDGTAFRRAFLEAAKESAAGRMEQTVVDSVTVESARNASRTLPAAHVKHLVHATPAAARHPGRKHLFVLASAAVTVFAACAAAFAYFHSVRSGHTPPGMVARARVSVPPRPAALVPERQGSLPQESAREAASRREAAPPRTKDARPDNTARQQVLEPAAAPPAIPRFGQATVPAGTEIHLTLNAAVGSARSKAGDTFTATIAGPVVAGDRVALPAGSAVFGHVSESVPAKKGLGDKAGSLSLSFDRVTTPAGFDAPMSAGLTRVASGSGKKTAGTIAGGAAGGALLGKILGKSTKDAAVGTVVGGALGTGIAAGTRGEDVELPAGSPLIVRLDQPLVVSIKP